MGWRSDYPENTMLSFKAAAEIGVDQIETDIRITKDGELVLIHDATVDRTTDGTGRVIDYTYEELCKLDAGIKRGEQFRGTRIPKLTELLDYVKTLPTMTLDLELKEYPTEGHEEISYSVCDRVLALVEEYGFADRCVINTASGKLHEYILTKYNGRYKQHVYYPVNLMGTEMKVFPYSYGYCCCVFSDDVKNFQYVEDCGVRTWAGASVKDNDTVDWAIERGVELITCNNPDVVLKLLREKGYHK